MAARRRRKAAKRKKATRRKGITCTMEGRGKTRRRVCRNSKGRFVKTRGR